MSQRNVEQVIGRLATDEGFRRRFRDHPAATIRALLAEGVQLNVSEQRALAAINCDRLERFAATLDPRIQKVDLKGPEPGG